MFVAEIEDVHGNKDALAVFYSTPVRCLGAIQVALGLEATDADTLSAVAVQVSRKELPAAGTAGDWLDATTSHGVKQENTVTAAALNGNGGGLVATVGSNSTSSPLIPWLWVRFKMTVGANAMTAVKTKTQVMWNERPSFVRGDGSGLVLS